MVLKYLSVCKALSQYNNSFWDLLGKFSRHKRKHGMSLIRWQIFRQLFNKL